MFVFNYPSLSFLPPLQHCNIDVTFSPCLEISVIKREAVRIAEKMAEIERKRSEEKLAKEKDEEVTQTGRKNLNKAVKKSGKGSPKRGQSINAQCDGNQATLTKINSIMDIVEE